MARLPKLIAVALLLGGLAAAAAPWRVARSLVVDAVGGGLAHAGGVTVAVAGPVTFKLLPRPRIQATALTITAEDGAVLVDAPLLKAELDIPSLLRGTWRLSTATLVDPTVTLDVDRLAARPTAPLILARAPGLPYQLRLRSGVLRTRSAMPFADMVATGLDASIAWAGEGGAVVVSGGATWRGAAVQFAGDLQHAADAFAPTGSAAALQIDSPLFSLSADGILSGGEREQFTGRASLSTPALPRLLRTLDGVPVALAGRRAQVSGDLVVKLNDLSLSNALLRLDGARFEGTMAWRRDAGRGLLAGTLATDLLDLDALAGDRLDRPALDALYQRRLDASPFGTDLDLRISAATARLGRLAVEDVAGAVLVRGDRLELTLDEASGYGGLVKARAVATLSAEGIDAHADLSATRLDLARLSDGLSGDERVGGALTGRAALDGRGASLRDVVGRLAGQGQVAIDGGRLAGLSLAQALRRLGRRQPLDAARRGTPTTFDRALWDIAVVDGVARIPDGRLTAPGVAMTFGAEAALPDGRIAVHAVAAQTDGDGAPLQGGQRLPFDVSGVWPGPLALVARGLPSLARPLLDGAVPLR